MASLDEINQQQRLANFPPDRRWQQITGVMIQPRSSAGHPPLVAIAGLGQQGEPVRIWTDLPNAMFLMNMLSQLRPEHFSSVPSTQPPACEPYDGSPY